MQNKIIENVEIQSLKEQIENLTNDLATLRSLANLHENQSTKDGSSKINIEYSLPDEMTFPENKAINSSYEGYKKEETNSKLKQEVNQLREKVESEVFYLKII